MSKQFTLAELSKLTQTDLVGDPTLVISSVNSLEAASPSDASFLANPKYHEAMKHSHAGVICIDRKTEVVKGKNFLIGDNPSRTFQLIAERVLKQMHYFSGFTKIHPTAVIHETAIVGENVNIGPYAVVDAEAVIGDNCHLYPHVYVGVGVKIGKGAILYSHSSVRERCTLGDRVILQPGAVIGSCGYGYTTDPQTGQHTKLEQLGTVTLEEDVEIGANSTIDRARFSTTLIRKGTKIDNLVQIAHNVELGENNIIVSQTGIAGSAKLGKNVVLGGQAGVVGHIEICDNVKVATRGGVSKSISKPGLYGGSPVSPLAEYNKRQVLLRKIAYFAEELSSLKEKLHRLEKHLSKEGS